MPSSACNDCSNMIKAHIKLGGDDPAMWACTHPLRLPISCYTGMPNGHLGYQKEDCPDQDSGECHYIDYDEEESAELREARDEYGDYGPEYLAKGVELAMKYLEETTDDEDDDS